MVLLRGHDVDVTLDLYGDGPERQAIETLLVDRGLRDRVTLHGYRADWLTQAIEADIFLNLAEAEGFCIVVAEAMLAGLPVIAVDVGGVRDYGRKDENMVKLCCDQLRGTLTTAILRLIVIFVCANAWAGRPAKTCFRTTTSSHRGTRCRRRSHRHDGQRSPRHRRSANRNGLADVSSRELRRRRTTNTTVGASARRARSRRDAACAAPRGERPRESARGPSTYGATSCVRLRIWAVACGFIRLVVSLRLRWLWRNRRSYDLIYVVHGRLHAFPAALAGRRLHKPVVVKPGRGGEASFDLSVVRRKRLLGSFFARSIARNTTAWVANSKEIAADLMRWGVPSERVHAIPNGVEIPDDEEQRSRNGVVRFVSMGRLETEKAVDQTIRAFGGLPADAPARLTVLGDGPCRPELEALSQRLGQERRIAFTGEVGDVTPYLEEADVYVSSSVSEGMSNALLEAMSSGVMPVVSRVSGVDDLVEEGVSGLLFPPGDENALGTRLEKSLAMSAEHRRATGEAARDSVRARFSLDLVVERHLSLYRSLIESAT